MAATGLRLALVCSAGLSAAAVLAQRHPLDPLQTNEIAAVTRILLDSGKAKTNDLFTQVALQEPPKQEVLDWRPGAGFRRMAVRT